MNNLLFCFSVCVHIDKSMNMLCVVSDCIASFLLMRIEYSPRPGYQESNGNVSCSPAL